MAVVDANVLIYLVNDAHLAALALAHNFPVVSFDRDFALFPGIVWQTP